METKERFIAKRNVFSKIRILLHYLKIERSHQEKNYIEAQVETVIFVSNHFIRAAILVIRFSNFTLF